MIHNFLTAQRQAHLYASGFLAIITLGTLALIALCIAALWALVEVAALLLTATIETCAAIGSTYVAADPLVRFLILAGISYITWRAGRRMLRRA